MRRLTNWLIIQIIFTFLSSTYAFGAEGLKYDGKGRRDPFTPLVTSEGRILPGAKSDNVETGSIALEGIIWDEKGKSIAIINGKLVSEKDLVLGMRILKINKDNILINKDGKAVKINLIKKKGEGQDGNEK